MFKSAHCLAAHVNQLGIFFYIVKCEKGRDIPWLAAVRDSLNSMNLHDMRGLNKKFLQEALYDKYHSARYEKEFSKSSVARYMYLEDARCSFSHLPSSYLLKNIGCWERGLLFRLRAGTLKFLLCFPLRFNVNLDEMPCPCDNRGNQPMLHFLFFCNFYQIYTKWFLIPFFKKTAILDYKAAYTEILKLEEDDLVFRMGSFLKAAVRSRASMSIH